MSKSIRDKAYELGIVLQGPSDVLSDFELAFQNAVRFHWPLTTIKGMLTRSSPILKKTFKKTDNWKISYFNVKPFLGNCSRTNNHVESYNKYLNKILQQPHPNLWKFIEFIQTQDNKMALDLYEQEKIHFYPKYQSKKQKTLEHIELVLKEALVSNSITFGDYFIKIASGVDLDYIVDDLSLMIDLSILPRTESANIDLLELEMYWVFTKSARQFFKSAHL